MIIPSALWEVEQSGQQVLGSEQHEIFKTENIVGDLPRLSRWYVCDASSPGCLCPQARDLQEPTAEICLRY